ncbi:MAG: pyridoxal phosphate-dependent aminotransferase [bacterium]|nr:pyridoxal phosphate-dependent aminotransferase [bacterium]
MFSSRARQVEPFLAMEVMERALVLERSGVNIIHLEVGEPEFPPPQAAVDACRADMNENQPRYTDSRGLLELREAIAADQERRHGSVVDPDCVIVTNGTSPAMVLVFSLLVEHGDEVVLGTPHYACYPDLIRLAGGKPILVRTSPGDGYRLDPDAVRQAITPRTRAILINSPANPTGAVQDRETLEAIAALGVPIVSDEIYDGLVYDGTEVCSGLSLDADVFVLDGFSKRYAMTGFRLGYLIAPIEAMRPLQSLAQNLFISATSFVQRAGIAALKHGAATTRDIRTAYETRRRLLLDGVRALGFEVSCAPRGAFYVFANATRFDADSRHFAFEILEKAHVALTPGIDFGKAGEGYIRFSVTRSEEEIREALRRLGKMLSGR